MKRFCRVVEHLEVESPLAHRGDKLLPHIDRQLLRQIDHFVGQSFDHCLELLLLEFAELFLDPAFQLARGVCVAAIEIKRERNRIPILQTRPPACRNNERRLHMFTQQIGLAADLLPHSPFEGCAVD